MRDLAIKAGKCNPTKRERAVTMIEQSDGHFGDYQVERLFGRLMSKGFERLDAARLIAAT